MDYGQSGPRSLWPGLAHGGMGRQWPGGRMPYGANSPFTLTPSQVAGVLILSAGMGTGTLALFLR